MVWMKRVPAAPSFQGDTQLAHAGTDAFLELDHDVASHRWFLISSRDTVMLALRSSRSRSFATCGLSCIVF